MSGARDGRQYTQYDSKLMYQQDPGSLPEHTPSLFHPHVVLFFLFAVDSCRSLSMVPPVSQHRSFLLHDERLRFCVDTLYYR